MRANMHSQRGLTLVELMVAVGIGTLLLLGVGILFSQNRQSYLQNEEIARMQENARVALAELFNDVSMAGYFGEIVDRLVVSVEPGAQLPFCGSSSASHPDWFSNWFYDFSGGLVDGALRVTTNVSTTSAQAAFSCIPAALDGTDIIGIRRTSGIASFWDADDGSDPCGGLRLPTGAPCAISPTTGVFFRENDAIGVLFPASAPPATPTPPFADWEYTPRVYYVRNTVVDGRNVPTLCRQRLDNAAASPSMVEECLAQGVEDMRILVGVDLSGDGSANAYVSTDESVNLNAAVSVRIYLLMRSTRPDPGYIDNRSYSYGGKDFTPPAGDRFHRRVYSTTVSLRNLNNIRQLGF